MYIKNESDIYEWQEDLKANGQNPNEKLYRVLKYIAQIVLPAFATLWLTLGKIWGFPLSNEIGATLMALDTFLGALLNISSKNYKEDQENAG